MVSAGGGGVGEALVVAVGVGVLGCAHPVIKSATDKTLINNQTIVFFMPFLHLPPFLGYS
jgi:hypothetical protein